MKLYAFTIAISNHHSSCLSSFIQLLLAFNKIDSQPLIITPSRFATLSFKMLIYVHLRIIFLVFISSSRLLKGPKKNRAKQKMLSPIVFILTLRSRSSRINFNITIPTSIARQIAYAASPSYASF
jgi:hypothetical protein